MTLIQTFTPLLKHSEATTDPTEFAFFDAEERKITRLRRSAIGYAVELGGAERGVERRGGRREERRRRRGNGEWIQRIRERVIGLVCVVCTCHIMLFDLTAAAWSQFSFSSKSNLVDS